MMTAAMAGMASRLTQQARQDAQAKIEQWQRAVEAVREAERQANMTIDLPMSLTTAANRAETAVPTADYVTAVGLASQAISAAVETMAVANDALLKTVQARSVNMMDLQIHLERSKEDLEEAICQVS